MSDDPRLAAYADILSDSPQESAQASKPKLSMVPEVDPELSDYADILTTPMPQKESATRLTREPVPGWQAGYKAFSDRLTIGGAAANKANAGWMLAAGGSMEDAQDQVNTQSFLAAQHDTEDYINSHGYQQLFRMRDLPGWNQKDPTGIHQSDIPGWLIESIPSLGQTAMGAFYGGVAGSVFGLPGVATGAFIGGAAATGMTIFGSHVYDQMERGVPKETAVLGGAISGTIGGVATTIGFGILGKAIPSVAKAVLASSSFKEAANQVFGHIVKSAALDLTANEAQALVEVSTKYVESMATHPKNPYKLEDALRELTMATAQGALLSTSLATTGGVAGGAAGWRARAMKIHLENKIQQFHEAMAAKAAAEAEKEISSTLEVSAKLADNVEESQAAAKKKLGKFLNADGSGDVPAAKANYEKAKAQYETAPEPQKARAKLALDQAKAELEATRYQVRAQALEEILSEPDLVGRVAEQEKFTIEEINKFDDFLKDLENRGAGPDNAAIKFYQKLKAEAESQLRMIRTIKGLSSELEMRNKLTAMKAEIDAKVDATLKEVAVKALKSSTAERGAKIDVLRGEIRDEKAVARNEGGEADTAAKRDQLASMRAEQEFDTELLGMVESGEITGSEARALAPSVKSNRLIRLAGLAKKKLESAFKLTGKAKAKAITAARKLAVGLIESSRLSKEDKTRLKAKLGVDDLNTLAATIESLEASIQKLFDKRQLEAAHKDLKAQIESLDFDPTKPSQYPEVEPILMALRDFYNDPNSVYVFLEKMLDAEGDPTLTDMAIMEMIDLFDKPLKEMDAAQVTKILDMVVELKTTGKAKALANFTARKTRQAEKVAVMSVRLRPNAKNTNRLTASKLNLVRRLFDETVSAVSSSWRGLMYLVSQWGEIGDMTDVFDLKSAHSVFQGMRIEWEQRLKTLLKGDLTEKEWHRFQRQAERRAPVLEYQVIEQGENGRPQRVWKELCREDGTGHTYNELIQIRNYLLDEDPDAKSRFEGGNEYSYPDEKLNGQSTLEVIEAHLDESLPHWEEVANGYRQFYKEFATVVDEASKRRFGRPLAKNDTYGGQLHGYTETGGRFKETFRRASSRPGSLKKRKGGSAAVRIKSAADNAKDHITQYSRDLAFHEFEQDAQAVFSDPTIKRMITRNNGENTMRAINKFIEDVVLGYQRNYTQTDRIFATLRDHMYTKFLALRPEQFVKQMTGVIQALQFISPTELIDGWAYMLANPEKVKADMQQSGLYRARAELRDPDFKPGGGSFLKNLNNSLMLPVSAGDHVSVAGSAYPVYLSVLKKTGDEVAARKAFETVFDTTQSSGSIDELPGLFRANPLYRFFTTLSQEPTRQVEAIANARRKYANNPTKETRANYHHIIAVTYAGAAAYNLMGWAILAPFLSDEDRDKKLASILAVTPLGPYGGVTFFGGLLTATMTQTLGVAINPATKAYEPHLIPADPFSDVFKTFKAWWEFPDKQDGWKVTTETANSIGTLTGFPATTAIKPFKQKD
jgi:hypothetical protein